MNYTIYNNGYLSALIPRFPGNYVRLKRKREGESATGTEKVSGIASNTQDSARSEDS